MSTDHIQHIGEVGTRKNYFNSVVKIPGLVMVVIRHHYSVLLLGLFSIFEVLLSDLILKFKMVVGAPVTSNSFNWVYQCGFKVDMLVVCTGCCINITRLSVYQVYN